MAERFPKPFFFENIAITLTYVNIYCICVICFSLVTLFVGLRKQRKAGQNERKRVRQIMETEKQVRKRKQKKRYEKV